MRIFFLDADKPIRKEYELAQSGEIIKHNYPFVYEVSSTESHPTTLQDLHKLVLRNSLTGACLLKGELSRTLVKESRKGTTDAEQNTDWICLDLDGVEGYQSLDLFLSDIGASDVDHIVQWSSSMGIEASTGFRCHVFMKLAKPQHPQLLKFWLMGLNLNIPTLSSQLELTKTGNALKWTLDVTTCQNDKLLYISPPKLGKGIKDPFPNNKRITFEKRKRATLTLPFPLPTKDALRVLTDTKISELRAAASLPKRKATKYKFAGTTEYMVNPDSAVITESKTERGFVYFNLNGGRSWAYFHPEDNPTFIHNFKGEPSYRTEDLLPEYWAKIQASAASYTPNTQGMIYLAFRDFRTSNYFNGSYDTGTQTLNLAMAKNESQLRQYLKQHGQTIGEFIPDWDLTWDPHTTLVVDPHAQQLNTYQPSIYMANQSPPVLKGANNVIPPTISKVIDHVLGHDANTTDHFINWLACIIKYKTRTGTAWIWQGTQGTGKGVLFHHIITPLLGDTNVVSKRMEELESEFTGFMENVFVAFIDEIEAGKSLYHSKVTAKLKNLIVEPTISIRKMYTPAYMATNHASMIFASNKTGAVEVAPDDRRFNVSPYQDQPIVLTSLEVDTLLERELPAFYSFLHSYKADAARARKPLVSAARENMIQINRTAIDTVADKLLAGDLEFLWEHMPADANRLTQFEAVRYQPFKALIKELVTDPLLENKLTREDLFVILDWCIGGMPSSPHKFTSLLKHHRLNMTQVWKHGRNVRGVNVTWIAEPKWLASAQAEIASGVI